MRAPSPGTLALCRAQLVKLEDLDREQLVGTPRREVDDAERPGQLALQS